MELFYSTLGFGLGLNIEGKKNINSNVLLLSENTNGHQIFKKEKGRSLNEYIKKLNVTLGSVVTRRQALSHLLVLLPQCNETVLVNNGSYWIKQCTQSLKTDDKELIVASIIVMRIILRHCHNNKELFNQIIKCNTDFLTPVCSLDLEFVEHSCDCLFDFLRSFSNKGLAFKTQIEALIFSTFTLPLETRSRKKLRTAGKVYAVLPLPGGASKGTEAQARGSQLMQLIALAHSAFDVLFSNVREIETYELGREHKLPVTMLESALVLNEPIRSLLTASTLISHLFDFLGGFLENVPAMKMNPKELIRLPLRALQVESENFSGAFLEAKAGAFILPSIHLRALRLLKDLVNINVCSVFLSHVEEQVVSSLKSRHQKPSKDKGEADNSIPAATILCYEILASIVKINKGCHKSTIEGVVPVIMKDIVPIKDSVVLNAAVRGGRLSLINAKKKTKKKGYTVTANVGAETQDMSQMINQSVGITAAALKLAESLFLHASHVMSHKIVSSLSKQLIALLRNCRLGAYTKPEVRGCLLSAVSAYALYPHPLCPPSYAFLCTAFQDGARDPNPTVSAICEKTLAVLSFVVANPNLTSLSDAARLTTQTEPDTQTRDLDEPHIPILDAANESEITVNGGGEHTESEDNEDEKINVSIENDTESKNESEDSGQCDVSDQEISDSSTNDKKRLTRENEIEKNKLTGENEYDNAIEVVDNVENENVESELISDCESLNKTIVEVEENAKDLKIDGEDNMINASGVTEKCFTQKKKRNLLVNKTNSRKKLKSDDEVTESGIPLLEEMLSSFVDADPDPM